MTIIKQNTIKYLLSIAILALFANGCGRGCPPNPDYTTEIKEILDPVAQVLEDFYTKNQRFPNTRERNIILQDRGCLIGNKGAQYCKKYGVWFEIISRVEGLRDYVLYIKHREVSCYVELEKSGLKERDYSRCIEYCGLLWGH